MLDQPSTAISDQAWHDVTQRIAALVEGEDDAIAKMATISCELFHAFDHFTGSAFIAISAARP